MDPSLFWFLVYSSDGMRIRRNSGSLGPMLGIPLQIEDPPCQGIRVSLWHLYMWFLRVVAFRHQIGSNWWGDLTQLDIWWPLVFLSLDLLGLWERWRVPWMCWVTFAKLPCHGCILQMLPWVVWILSPAKLLPVLRDNVVYWKTKRKINDDLQCN